MKNLLIATATAALFAAAPAYANHHGGEKHEMKKDAKVMKKNMKKAKMEMKATAMSDIDVNGDDQVDFTEFSNYYESKHGWTAADSAVEYVRLVNDNGTIDAEGLDRVQIPAMRNGGNMVTGTMVESDTMTETMVSDDGMTKTETVTTTTTVTTDGMTKTTSEKMMSDGVKTETTKFIINDGDVQTTTKMMMVDEPMNMDYGVFADYDANKDGSVSFSEYRKVRAKAGVTTTAAAQEFMRVSNGTASFNQTRFNTAVNTSLFVSPEYMLNR
jgi:hypothetical protein